MPPNQKITKDMILETGYRLTAESGIECVNSRSIAKALGCSTQPVFSQFPGMEELRQAVHDYACQQFEKSVLGGDSDFFIRSCYLRVTALAANETNIFRLIYMSKYCSGGNFIRRRMEFESNRRILEEIKTLYTLEDEDCNEVLERVSLLVHGIATSIAATHVHYTDSEIIRIVDSTLKDTVAGVKERRQGA